MSNFRSEKTVEAAVRLTGVILYTRDRLSAARERNGKRRLRKMIDHAKNRSEQRRAIFNKGSDYQVAHSLRLIKRACDIKARSSFFLCLAFLKMDVLDLRRKL